MESREDTAEGMTAQAARILRAEPRAGPSPGEVSGEVSGEVWGGVSGAIPSEIPSDQLRGDGVPETPASPLPERAPARGRALARAAFWRVMRQAFLPGLMAMGAGLLAHVIEGSLLTTLLAAGLGAAATALVLVSSEEYLPAGKTDGRALFDSEGGTLPVGAGRQLLAHMPVGIIVIDRSGTVEFMNAVAAGLFGRPAGGGGFHCSALRSPKLLEAIDATLAEGLASTVEFSIARRGGYTLHLRGHLRQFSGEGLAQGRLRSPVALAVIEDETQSRRAEELHRDFVANASHELKTPLASITAIIETLEGHAKDDPEAAKRFLGMMGAQAQRMKRLVEDLLSLNRVEVNERLQPRETHALWPILRDVVELLAPLASERGARLSVAHLGRPVTVLASREELSQVFQNLIENAIKYGGEGVTVSVERVENPTLRPEMIGIAIVDDGPGIAREHLARLTERFYRVSVSRSREIGGTGLGLAIVKHVINRHRGALEIESQFGSGSRFTVWLPVHRGPASGRARGSDRSAT